MAKSRKSPIQKKEFGGAAQTDISFAETKLKPNNSRVMKQGEALYEDWPMAA